MYYISLFFLFIKIFYAHFEFYILNTSVKENLVLLSIILTFIIIIKYINKMPVKEEILFRIMKYKFEYALERYYSAFIVCGSIMSYIGLLLYVRLLSVEKTISLLQLIETLNAIIHQIPFIIILVLFLLALSGFYLIFFLLLKALRLYVYKELIKLHFYYYDNYYYKTFMEAVKIKYSISGFYGLLLGLFFKLCEYLALGYNINKKGTPYRSATKKEKEKKTAYWLYRKVNLYYLLPIFYNMHYILLILFLVYDIVFNNFQIQYTFKLLPYLFIYQLYAALSKFTVEHAYTDICAYTNVYFYHHVVLLEHNAMVIDGEVSEVPFNFAEEFLKYEASGFTKGYGTTTIY